MRWRLRVAWWCGAMCVIYAISVSSNQDHWSATKELRIVVLDRKLFLKPPFVFDVRDAQPRSRRRGPWTVICVQFMTQSSCIADTALCRLVKRLTWSGISVASTPSLRPLFLARHFLLCPHLISKQYNLADHSHVFCTLCTIFNYYPDCFSMGISIKVCSCISFSWLANRLEHFLLSFIRKQLILLCSLLGLQVKSRLYSVFPFAHPGHKKGIGSWYLNRDYSDRLQTQAEALLSVVRS